MRLTTALRATALTALAAGAGVLPAAAPAAATGSQPTDQIRNVSTGRCLSQTGQANGAVYQAWCNPFSWTQQWQRSPVWGGLYRIRGPQGGRCLSAVGTYPGSPVRAQWCGGGGQLWQVTWAMGGGYRVRSQTSGLCLTASGGNWITQARCTPTGFSGYQRWHFV